MWAGVIRMDYYAIGQRIRKIRKARNLTQDELAEKVGISTTHMSHIETGNTKLSLPVFISLASALDIRTDELLHEGRQVDRSAAVEGINQILEGCSTQQIKILEDIIKAAKMSLDKHL